MKKKSYETFFSNFSNRTRVAIINVLMEKPMNVGEIAEKIGEEQSNVSHHLAHLSRCKLLNVKKKGKQRIYSLNKKTVKPMLKLFEKHFYSCGDCSTCGMCAIEK